MLFSIELSGVVPIGTLKFEIDLALNHPTCIVGKNGSGKTTLVKAVLNFALADTFRRTSSDGIFDPSSTIRYVIGDEEFLFSYDDALGTLNCKKPIPSTLKEMISVELPIPHGHRFNFFQTLSDADHEIRRAIILGQYRSPTELIGLLSRIYGEHRFDNLVEVKIRNTACSCILLPDGRYLREDYFSSGEYFLISLYRRFLEGKQLIVIDEIDISLDAAAQARLVPELRALCQQHHVNIVFTSHSLAMMQTLDPGELVYLERTGQNATLTPASFSYVKSLMFGFKGRDKYILTEDDVLRDFVEFVIKRYCPPAFFSYSVIEVAGGAQVVDLMRRNRREEFLGPEKNVISVLDGDQHQEGHAQTRNTFCIPLPNVERAFWDEYHRADFQARVTVDTPFPSPKTLYRFMTRKKALSPEEIFKLICDRHDDSIREFAKTLEGFLCRPA